MPGSIMGRVPVYFSLFDRLREIADVILLDQRGTGLSSPSLQCPPPDVSASPDALMDDKKALKQITAALQACTDQLRSQGIDLAAYTANATADDVDDLRKALGAEKISLLGVSYGTHLALATIRRHNEYIHRAVLAGTLGPDNSLFLPSIMEILLTKLSQLTAQDSVTSQSVPDFAALIHQVIERFDKYPVTLTVTDRRTKRPVNITVGKVALQVLLQGMSDGRAIPTLPALFYTISKGDYSLLIPQVERIYNSLNGSGNSAMSVAMTCSSGWSAERMTRVEREAKQSLLGNAMNLQTCPEVCKLVGNPDLGPDFRSRIWSTIPTLFVSGTLDGTTPPYQAEEVRWGFPNSVHLIVENAAHETLPYDEVQVITVDFFKGQDVSGRRLSLPRPRFVSVDKARSQ